MGGNGRYRAVMGGMAFGALTLAVLFTAFVRLGPPSTDFIRQTTEQLAKDGFVAIAPDLLSRRGGTPSSPDSARKLIATLNADTITQDLDATRAYLKTLQPVRSGEIGVIGFCWGGGQSFRYATNAPELKAFVVCYGPSPNPADMAKIRAKGLGVYAENDARINAGLPPATAPRRGRWPDPGRPARGGAAAACSSPSPCPAPKSPNPQQSSPQA